MSNIYIYVHGICSYLSFFTPFMTLMSVWDNTCLPSPGSPGVAHASVPG